MIIKSTSIIFKLDYLAVCVHTLFHDNLIIQFHCNLHLGLLTENKTTMTDPLTKGIKKLNFMHEAMNSSFLKCSKYTSRNPKNFVKVATVLVVSSGLLGLGLMEIVTRKREVGNWLSFS